MANGACVAKTVFVLYLHHKKVAIVTLKAQGIKRRICKKNVLAGILTVKA
jgi:hypothetical protein